MFFIDVIGDVFDGLISDTIRKNFFPTQLALPGLETFTEATLNVCQKVNIHNFGAEAIYPEDVDHNAVYVVLETLNLQNNRMKFNKKFEFRLLWQKAVF